MFSNHASLYGDVLPHLREEEEEGGLRVLNNLDWYGDMGVLDFMATYGRNFRIVRMLRTRYRSGQGVRNTET